MKNRLLFIVLAAGLSTNVAYAQSDFNFPIEGGNPYTHNIGAVLDHSANTAFYCHADPDEKVVAYTGEAGDVEFAGARIYACGNTEYQNPSGTAFLVNGKYLYGAVLSYDGHPGYDFSPNSGSEAFMVAPSEGILKIPASDPINGDNNQKSPWCGWHTLMIDHGEGWTTWFLHGEEELLVDIPPGYEEELDCSVDTEQTEDIILDERFPAGSRFARVGSFPSVGFHLHFELRKDGKVVDPYGWEWSTKDPIASNQQALVLPGNPILWSGYTRPKISSVDIQPTQDEEYVITVVGNGFSPGSLIALWDESGTWRGTPGDQALEGTTVIQGTIDADTILGSETTGDLSSLFVKVKLPQGPRSLPRQISDETEPDEPIAAESEPEEVEDEPVCSFPDLNATSESDDHWARSYIEALCRIRIFSGDTGIARPNDPINRAEFVKLLVESLDYQDGLDADLEQAVTENPFSDVQATDGNVQWYIRHVEYAKEMGLVSGFEDGTFRPSNPITRAEAAKILLISFKLTPDQNDEETQDNLGEPNLLGSVAEEYLQLQEACANEDVCEEVSSEFTDVADQHNDWFYYYVYGVREAGTMTGYTDESGNPTGRFGPLDVLRRSESAKLLCLTFLGEKSCEKR